MCDRENATQSMNPLARSPARSAPCVFSRAGVRLLQEKTQMGTPRHGHRPRGYATPTYHSWTAMKSRCFCLNAFGYERYGGRGITVCEKWMRFEGFLDDMGERPEGTSLDRIDNNGNYEPDNCRWATAKQQQRNTQKNVRLTFNGKTRCLKEWAEIVGINHHTIRSRIRKSGWSTEKALTTPPLPNNKRAHGCPK